MNILITGINGFVGSHLANHFVSKEKSANVFGTIRNRSSLSNLEYFGIKDKVILKECELTDATNVNDLIKNTKPDKIFHLAAQSYVPTSWKSPADTLYNNVISEVNILEAVRNFCQDCKILIAGSSEEYGNPVSALITEDYSLDPLSPYGVSKVAQDKLGCQYAKSYGLKVVVTRAFNHTGVLRHHNFVCPAFAKQVADAKSGDFIKVGNLEAIRDFTDVEDMVRAYAMALDCDKIDYGVPYNISSQQGYKIRSVLDMLIEISDKELLTEEDPKRMRPSDIRILIGDSNKFREITGWQPQIKFEDTLKKIYNYYVNKNKFRLS